MPEPCRIQVCIAHRNAFVAQGLRAALAQQEGIALVDTAHAQIVLADPSCGQALARGGAAKVLVVAEDDQPQELRLALAAGVDGYLHLDGSAHDLLTGIRRLASGARYLGATAAQRVVDSLRHGALTARQQQVLRLVARGHSNKRVAQMLCITPGTVKSHMKAILALLGARSRTHAARIARERGLLSEAEPVGAEAVHPPR